MNVLLFIGLLLTIGYSIGWIFDKNGIPKAIAYIGTGIIFSPNTIDLVDYHIIESTHSIMEVCLAFIAFEVGGALKWSKIKEHEREIISITLLASFLPYILIATSVFLLGLYFPTFLPFDSSTILLLALLLGALSSSTAPAATLAVIHQFKAKGKVTDTILGVAALDDVLGILLFSLTIAAVSIISGNHSDLIGIPILNSIYEVVIAFGIGLITGIIIILLSNYLKMESEGQWIVIVFSLIILNVGMAEIMNVDFLLSSMSMGMVVVNKCKHQKVIFRILRRYTEDLIFLFFFILSGLHLDISSIPETTILILIFFIMRFIGKYIGANIGAKIVGADKSIQKYTAGGLLPQAGIVIGLVLSIYKDEQFGNIAETLLTTIMGTTIICALLGPVFAKYSLKKAGEIKLHQMSHLQNKNPEPQEEK